MFSYFLSPRGRFRRRDLVFGFAVLLLIVATGFSIDVALGGVAFVPVAVLSETPLTSFPIFAIMTGVACLWPATAMIIKRWHDRDVSGMRTFWLLVPVLNLLALFMLFAMPGFRGLNQFGPDPREEERYHRAITAGAAQVR